MVLQAEDVEGEEEAVVVVVMQAGELLLDRMGVGYDVYFQLEDGFASLLSSLWNLLYYFGII